MGSKPKVDVRWKNHGSVVMVEPITDFAKAWVRDNVSLEGWQWMGAAFAVDPRYLDVLFEGMSADGLVVA